MFFSERFYLVWWEDENNVSIHSEEELKKGDPEGQLSVGCACVVRFGRREYTGKIASVGT